MAAAFLFIGQQAIAQSGFGFRFGAVSSDQSINVLDLNPKSKIGLDVGVLYNLDLGGGLALQPEVHYTQMGFKVNAFITNLKANMDYVRIPVLFKYDVLSKNENLNLSPFIGPYLAILANEDIDLVSLIGDLPIKGTDVGMDFGVMLKLANGLFFDVRYSQGFGNILDLPVGEIKNSAFGAGIGYMF